MPMATLYLSLGTNMGDRPKNLSQAMELIAREVGTVVAASDVIETEPWGFDSGNAFLNMVAKVETELEPIDALHVTQDIEKRLGRSEKSVNGVYHDRIIDIDLLMYDDLIMNTPQLTLPHPLMRQRPFVMEPLSQIAPELTRS
jgi:2-amino-4-hydroxy-6-hydroxymethyldihydropteridine diphosphokinase